MRGHVDLPMTHLAREALEAPGVVGRQLAANRDLCAELGERFRGGGVRLVLTCARGSSDHAATYAKYLIETTLGIPVSSAAPSIGSVYRRPMALQGALLLSISQSGESPDLVAYTRWAREQGAFAVGLLNTLPSPLAEASDRVVPLRAGVERSVAATKSTIASLSALLQLVAHAARDPALLAALERLEADLDRAAHLDWSAARGALAGRDRLLVVGRGLGFAVAQEAALKLKETSGIHAEAFSAAELAHGPLALVGEGDPVLVFNQDDETRATTDALLAALRRQGARPYAAESGPAEPTRLAIVEGMDARAQPLAMIQAFYGLADAIARSRGRNPDRPAHLSKVTRTR